MKLAIFGRVTDNTDTQVLVRYFEYLHYANIPFVIYADYLKELHHRFPKLFPPENFVTFSNPGDLQEVKFLLSLGGDGTVLECVRMLGNYPRRIPILGINFGRLGYLTSITQQDIVAATHLLERDIFRIDTRGLLDVVSQPAGLFGQKNFGLNDLTIHKSNTNEMITVHVYVNGEFLNSYRGDGLIIATPTGSTAYSLACGGPILFPASQNFIITPVAPHSLTVRPVVIPDSWVISCEVESRSGQAMTALDTRTELIQAGTSLAIRKAPFEVALVRLPESKYIATLRKTLMWGSDARK